MRLRTSLCHPSMSFRCLMLCTYVSSILYFVVFLPILTPLQPRMPSAPLADVWLRRGGRARSASRASEPHSKLPARRAPNSPAAHWLHTGAHAPRGRSLDLRLAFLFSCLTLVLGVESTSLLADDLRHPRPSSVRALGVLPLCVGALSRAPALLRFACSSSMYTIDASARVVVLWPQKLEQ